MCGCGSDEPLKMIYEVLKAHDQHHYDYDNKKKSCISACGNEASWEFILHVLDNYNFMEHGGSVYGSWLTDKGKNLLNDLSILLETV